MMHLPVLAKLKNQVMTHNRSVLHKGAVEWNSLNWSYSKYRDISSLRKSKNGGLKQQCPSYYRSITTTYTEWCCLSVEKKDIYRIVGIGSQGRTRGGGEGALAPPLHPNLHRQA